MGFGRELFEAARTTLATSGFRSIAIRALADNLVATAFYAAMGGQEIARRLEVVGRKVLPMAIFGWGKDVKRAA